MSGTNPAGNGLSTPRGPRPYWRSQARTGDDGPGDADALFALPIASHGLPLPSTIRRRQGTGLRPGAASPAARRSGYRACVRSGGSGAGPGAAASSLVRNARPALDSGLLAAVATETGQLSCVPATLIVGRSGRLAANDSGRKATPRPLRTSNHESPNSLRIEHVTRVYSSPILLTPQYIVH